VSSSVIFAPHSYWVFIVFYLINLARVHIIALCGMCVANCIFFISLLLSCHSQQPLSKSSPLCPQLRVDNSSQHQRKLERKSAGRRGLPCIWVLMEKTAEERGRGKSNRERERQVWREGNKRMREEGSQPTS